MWEKARSVTFREFRSTTMLLFVLDLGITLQSWIPDNYSCKVNDVDYEAEDLRGAVEFLVQVSMRNNDQRL